MAAVDYFLKIEGIQGESQDAKHPNELQLESWSWGAHQGGTMGFGGGGGAGKVQLQDFHFTMKNNKASPILFIACCKGTHIPSAVLVCRKAGGEQMEYLKYTFTDLLVSSFTCSGSGSSDVLPMDQVSINFSKIQEDYKMQNKDGTPSGALTKWYDAKTQTNG